MTPADVAENLMPKTVGGDVDTSLGTLIQALETAKEEARVKTKEETKENVMAKEEGEVDADEKDTKEEEEGKENG